METNSNDVDVSKQPNVDDVDVSKQAKVYAKQQKNVVHQLGLNLYQRWLSFLHFFGAIFYVFVWAILPIMSLWVPFYILFYTPFWPFAVAYSIWYVYDFETPSKGSRKWPAFRKLAVWRWFADYFPIRVVKTADLPGDKNYILGCHPHGVFSMGAFTATCTDGNGFSEMYPELDPTLLTLNGQFYFPFRREIGQWLGGCEVSRKSLAYLLKHPGKGRLIAIVIGGAEEALDACPGTYNLNILSRKGFCYYAITTGAAIVPSYSFGENDVYDQTVPNPLGSKIRTVQTIIKKKFGFCPPFFSGCGIFTAKYGLLPYKKPITTVIGAPIECPHEADPSRALVDEVHQRYCNALVDLFEKHKKDHGVAEDSHLVFY